MLKKYPEFIELIKLNNSIMCQIWKARNSKSFNEEISDPNNIVNKAFFNFHEHESNLIPSFSSRYISL